MNKKTVFRNKAVACTALVAFALLCSTSCTKPIDGAQNRPLDYALQVIPDIHEVMPHDLLEAMSAIPDTINGQPVIINALHFGDNPPILSIDSLGFAQTPDEVIYKKLFLPSDSTKIFANMANASFFHAVDWFRFYDQHRGVAKFNFKHVNEDDYQSTGRYYIEYANVIDSVFIMGSDSFFTAYLKIKRQLENTYGIEERGSTESLIISGKVTSQGVTDLYYAIKIEDYDNPTVPGFDSMNYNDIAIFYIENLPFVYWNPDQHYNN